MDNRLILSLFPGIGLLDRAFEECGFCVVRGPDKLWGGDVRNFHPPAGVFWGVIGGPPCQDFSSLRRIAPTGEGLEMLEQYARCVTEAKPEWWLMENVARVPSVTTLLGHIFTELGHGYTIQRLDINLAWYCDVTRLRHIQFGSLSGRLLNVTRRSQAGAKHGAALASDDRPFSELCRLQGLPDDFDLPPFLASEKKRAVGNGVPLEMGRALATAIIDAYAKPTIVQCDFAGGVTVGKSCLCGCGRQVTGKQKYYDYSCRKRAQRKRDLARSQFEQSVTNRLVTEA
jgi:DNA (cytosine-5)-methyltransferase 1